MTICRFAFVQGVLRFNFIFTCSLLSIILFLLVTIISMDVTSAASQARNVYGQPLKKCCNDPLTGFYRDGYCNTGPEDHGTHVTCARMTDEFLQFSKSRGNDLITPHPQYRFPGLKAGDCWCLCAGRWVEALKAKVAPPVNLEATHIKALEFTTLDQLRSHMVAQDGRNTQSSNNKTEL